MLVLTRREGERIQIGDGVTLTVVRISPHAVRIGIEAPQETVVMRQELLEGSESREPPRPGSGSETPRHS